MITFLCFFFNTRGPIFSVFMRFFALFLIYIIHITNDYSCAVSNLSPSRFGEGFDSVLLTYFRCESFLFMKHLFYGIIVAVILQIGSGDG